MKSKERIVCGTIAALLLVSCGNKNEQAPKDEQAEMVGFYDHRAASAPADQQTSRAQSMPPVKSMEIPSDHNDYPQQILRREGYTVSYNSTSKCPNWVAWHLTKGHTYGRNQRSGVAFTEDTNVPSPRATDWDYYNSGYDRGHMCPAGDNKWDATAMAQTFLFTNICPQNHNLNKYEWNDVEMLCREWARQYGSVDIVCGPVFLKETSQKKMGRNKIWVPDAFFKVVLRRGEDPKAIGFLYDNVGSKQSLQAHVRSVDELEQITGIDFFPALAETIERRIEAEARLEDWNPHVPERLR